MNCYCTQCHADTEHSASILKGEVALHCDCGHFLKFPKVPKDQLQALIAKHREVNHPIVTSAKAAEEQASDDTDYLASLV